MSELRVSIAQINLTVGDMVGNVEKMKEAIRRAVTDQADVIVFPELSVCGYPVEDMVFKPQFLESNNRALDEIVEFSQWNPILIVLGFIHRDNEIYNAMALVHMGRIVDIYHKIFLPNYGVFDEMRYFAPGRSLSVYRYRGIRIAVNICEDIWYPHGPMHFQALSGGAEVIINISASPYYEGKQSYRETMYQTRAGDESVILINCNLVGGQDELVFDGSSTVYNENGELIARMRAFEEDFLSLDLKPSQVFLKRLKDIRRKQEKNVTLCPYDIKEIEIESPEYESRPLLNYVPIAKPLSPVESVYRALVLGTRDYVEKNGFKSVIIAISGGIDSALVAAIAVDALGKDRVKGIYLPSQFSAFISGEDARKLCDNLGIELFELPIKPLFENYDTLLKPLFGDLPFGIAEENLQSRIRGNIVMALSNKFGWLVLTTGNKSEMSTGYATLYGDMAGGFAVIKDVLKTLVYELSHYRNRLSSVIPARIIERPPSAELRPDQKDTDSLPEYAVLDRIITAYVEEDLPVSTTIEQIGDEALVRRVIGLIDRSEYKRRQAPPGVKITKRAFGKDRRIPITNRYRV